jgi:Fic family protein
MHKDPKTATQSRYVTSTLSGEKVRAFVPPPLPPNPQALDLAPLQAILAEANQAIGRLDGTTSSLPDLKLFLYSYVRKEAVLSSQIEGTQSSLSDLLLYENAETPGVPLDDVQEVSNYVAALNHGLKRMRDGFPLSLRLVREIHEVLLAKGRGSQAQPGQFRNAAVDRMIEAGILRESSGKPQFSWIGLWIGIFDLADAFPSMTALHFSQRALAVVNL